MKRKSHLKWGEVKHWTKPASNQPHDIFKFKCDKLRQELQEKLNKEVIVYTSDNYTQEELQKLARGEKLQGRKI